MISLWLLVVVVSIVQEFTSTAAVLLAAYRAGLSIWIINAIWVTATIAEIYVGSALGKWAERRFPNAKPTQWGKKIAGIARRNIGKGGKKFLLFSLGFLMFAPIVAFAAAWLDVPLA